MSPPLVSLGGNLVLWLWTYNYMYIFIYLYGYVYRLWDKCMPIGDRRFSDRCSS